MIWEVKEKVEKRKPPIRGRTLIYPWEDLKSKILKDVDDKVAEFISNILADNALRTFIDFVCALLIGVLFFKPSECGLIWIWFGLFISFLVLSIFSVWDFFIQDFFLVLLVSLFSFVPLPDDLDLCFGRLLDMKYSFLIFFICFICASFAFKEFFFFTILISFLIFI